MVESGLTETVSLSLGVLIVKVIRESFEDDASSAILSASDLVLVDPVSFDAASVDDASFFLVSSSMASLNEEICIL